LLVLDGILKGLVLWIYGLILEGVEYVADSLLDIFSMDLAYFETYAPVVNDIQNIVIAVGWALLIGNLVFQAMRSMAAGLGFEGEDPVTLGTRTFVFAFLLMASRQICAIGLNFTSVIMDLFQVPDAVEIITPEENAFGIDSSWLLAMVVGLILIFQVIKFFFEIGERYVVTVILVVLAPLAFGMGGSKNTEDIFKGWCRMFGSMCVMMLMNVIFLKLLLSTMSTVPSGPGIVPWLIFVTAIVRVGRKIDDIVCRMGLNPAHTGSPLGKGFVGGLTSMVAHQGARTIMQTISANRTGGGKAPASGNRSSNRPASGPSAPSPSPPSSPPPAGGSGGGGASSNTARTTSTSTHTGGAAPSPAGTATTAKAANPGNPTAPAASQVAQRNPSPSAQPKGSHAGEGTTPTRPPLGRGRVFTPPAAGGSEKSRHNSEHTSSAPATPAASGAPGKPGASNHPSPQASPTAAGGQERGAAPGQGKSTPLHAGTATPSNTGIGRDGRNAGTAQNPNPSSRPAPAGARSTSATSHTSAQRENTASHTQSEVHTQTAGAPGVPGRTASPASGQPSRATSKPGAGETASPAPSQNPAVRSGGVPVTNPGRVSGGTNQHEPSRAPTGVSGIKGPANAPAAAARPQQPTPQKGTAGASHPGAASKPITQAASADSTQPNPGRGSPRRPPSSASDKKPPSAQPVKPSAQDDKKHTPGGTRPPRPDEPRK